MRAILRKDFYVLGKYTIVLIITWIAVSVLFTWIPETETSNIYSIMPVMSAVAALNAVNVDHESHWDRFAAMTPLRPWQLVLERYLVTYGLSALLTGLSSLAVWAAASGENRTNMWTSIVLVLLAIATSLPLVYRFGQRQGRLILMVIWGLAAAAILGAALWDYRLIEAAFGWIEEVPAPALAIGLTVFLAAVNAWSLYLSIRFYTRRQRGWYE